jgi:UDP-N-acetylglucosamine 4,6-dehydratase
MKNFLKNKSILITGGTGSFGQKFLEKIISADFKQIRILSRDEKKQEDMRNKMHNSKIKFYIGDVRDKSSIAEAFKNIDYVFHAAALKQVPSCEFYPLEAIKTNTLGTQNVVDLCIENKIKKMVLLSTDKAVYPINSMGLSKALAERIVISKSRNLNSNDTMLCITRYGNVIGSRGSVIPLFLEQIDKNKEITITDGKMTRFMMSLNDSIDLVLYAMKNGKQGEIFVLKSPSSTIDLIAKTLIKTRNSKSKIKIIGTRHGEKDHEVLVSKEEMIRAMSENKFFRISPDIRDLNYANYFTKGNKKLSSIKQYSSDNTKKLNEKTLKKLLDKTIFNV